MIRSVKRRQVARHASRAATLFCAAMLALSAGNLVLSRQSVANAATVGSATVGPDGGGGSAASFTISLPDGAACSGDNNAGYTIQSYMVPSSVDPGTLVYAATGPTPPATGASFRRPLTQASSNQSFVNKFPDVQTGVVSGLPGFTLSIYSQGLTQVPAGIYNLGIACIQGGGASQTLDKYWNAQLTVAADAADALGFRWDPVAAPPTTTPPTTAAPTTAPPTTETPTTAPPTTASPTTAPPTGGAEVSGSGVSSGGGPSAASPVTTMGQLPYTGGSPLPMVFWAIALLVFGRTAMLLGKRPKVVGDGPPNDHR